jgi:Carboxypeptidase regulatory-like domain
MRSAALWLWVIFCCAALAAQAVTGTVTNGVTRQPVAGVSVSLISPRSDARVSGTSNATGAFRIADVAADDYFVVALQPGFEAPDLMSLRLHVAAGVDPAPLDITLIPWPKLSGRVLDPERHPLAGIAVSLIPFSGISMQPATTDKQGHYEFRTVPPGVYGLLANPLETGGSEFAPTYFPRAGEQMGCERITTKLGADLAGYDIVLRGGPFFHVRGRVLDEMGRPAGGAAVKIETQDATFGSAVADAEGAFQIEHVAAVDGHIIAVWKRGGVELRGFGAVAVTRHDVEDVTLRLSPPVRVTGTVEVDGETISPGLRVFASIAPVGGLGKGATAILNEEGFHFDDAYPGRYILFLIVGRGGGSYLDSVRMGERDITMQEFEIAPGMLPLRVVLRTGGGRVQANVDDPAGAGVVVLVPDETRLRIDPFVLSTANGAGGRFEFAGVRPGNYYAIALRGTVRKAQLQDADYLAALVRQGTPVRVERDATVAVDLRYRSAPE